VYITPGDWNRQIFLFMFQIFFLKVMNRRIIHVINNGVFGEKRQERDGRVVTVLYW
jgi:hypothetical protein